MGPTPENMWAWRCHEFDPDPTSALAGLRLEMLPVPRPGPEQILVRVLFAGVDPLDVSFLTGSYSDTFPITKFPFVPGFDAAGEVVELGPGCCGGFAAGDKVVLCLGVQESCRLGAAFGPGGALAEYCICPEAQLSKVPEEIALSRVAGLPLSGLTAYQALFTGSGSSTTGGPLGHVQKDSKVLVLGGNKGPGHLAVQMAARRGASVTTTVPPSCIHWMVYLGASRVINFREKFWVEHLKGEAYDLILDCVGWASNLEELDRAGEALRPGGQYISTSHFKTFGLLGPTGERNSRFFKAVVPKVVTEDLDALVQWVAYGDLEVAVDQVCSLADARHALHESAGGQCRGKILIYEGGAPRPDYTAVRQKWKFLHTPKVSDKTMKAWEYSRYTRDFLQPSVDQLLSLQPRPVPVPGKAQVLIRTHFASVDPMDMHFLSGDYRDQFPCGEGPFVPGFDCAGEIVALGPGCDRLEVGDKVVAFLGLEESCCEEASFGPAGACAEFCVCPERQASKVPEGTVLSRVAGLPLAGLTAYQALFTGRGASLKGDLLGHVREGSRVLVLGGNRGTGHLAVQLAHNAGAHVTTTVPPSCVEWMLQLGAQRAINFREEDFLEDLKDESFELVLDCVGWASTPEELDAVADIMAPGGQFIGISKFGIFTEHAPFGERRGRYFKAMVPRANAEDLDILVEQVQSGTLDVVTDQVCPFNELRHALREAVAGQCRGKVLLCNCGASRRAPMAASRESAPRPKLTQSTMRAWQCRAVDDFPHVALQELRTAEHAPLPALEDGQALVRVQFAAVDPWDMKLITNSLGCSFPRPKCPFVPGFDAAGEVVALGKGCTRLLVGDRVVLCLGLRESLGAPGEPLPGFGPAGACAEFCACPEAQISKVPHDVLLSEVVGLPLSGLTAYQALFTGNGCSTRGNTLGDIAKGDKVLILGGNRAVGHLAVQMAIRKGACVTVTVAPSHVDWMCALGVGRVIDFHEHSWAHLMQGEGFDLIFDCVGWCTTTEEMDLAAGALRPGGLFVSDSHFEAFDALGSQYMRHGRFFKAVMPRVNAEDLDMLVAWVDADILHVHTDQVCPFGSLRHALRESVAGQCCGKVLLCQRDASLEAGTGPQPGDAYVGGA